MKTLRYRIRNEVRPGILDGENNIRDASSLVKDWDDENLHVDKLNELKILIQALYLLLKITMDLRRVFVKKV